LQLKPDVAVLDLAMPELNGLEATRQIKAAVPSVEILIFTMHDSKELMLSALEAGARGFVLKSSDELELMEAIKVVSRHEAFIQNHSPISAVDQSRRVIRTTDNAT